MKGYTTLTVKGFIIYQKMAFLKGMITENDVYGKEELERTEKYSGCVHVPTDKYSAAMNSVLDLGNGAVKNPYTSNSMFDISMKEFESLIEKSKEWKKGKAEIGNGFYAPIIYL